MNRLIGLHAANDIFDVIRQFFCIAKIFWLHGSDVMPVQRALCSHRLSLLIFHAPTLP